MGKVKIGGYYAYWEHHPWFWGTDLVKNGDGKKLSAVFKKQPIISLATGNRRKFPVSHGH